MEYSTQGFYTDTRIRHGRFHTWILHRHTNQTWKIPHRDSTQTHESGMEDFTQEYNFFIFFFFRFRLLIQFYIVICRPSDHTVGRQITGPRFKPGTGDLEAGTLTTRPPGILHRHTNQTWKIPHRDSTQTHESYKEDST